MVRSIRVEPLCSEDFMQFGELLIPPNEAGRAYFDVALSNQRSAAFPSLSLSRVEAAKALPLNVTRMERHEKSSQSFIPLNSAPFLVLVAPHGSNGGPDMDNARAFIADEGIGVSYLANTWHHPITVFRAPAEFAVFMWRTGTADDEEFFDIEPMIVLPMESSDA